MDERDEFSEELDIDFKTTKDLPVDKLLIAQVIGQERGVSVIRKSAAKKRNVLLIGPPGTGKSMLGAAMAQLIPKEQLEDILAIPNRKDPNTPKVVVVPAGSGEQIVHYHLQRANKSKGLRNFISIAIPAVIVLLAFLTGQWLMGVFVALVAFLIINQVKIRSEQLVPKLLVDNSRKEYAPFLEATGAHSGAMLGDVRHDPFQCIPGFQRIHLPNGKSIPVKDLVDPIFDELKADSTTHEIDLPPSLQFEVLGGCDSFYCYDTAKVSRIYRRHYNDKLIQIRTERGHVIMVTPEHPIATINNGKIVYNPAKSFKETDTAILPHKYPITVDSKRLPLEFVLLLADILADGYIGQRSVQFKLKKDFKIQEIANDIRQNGLTPKVRTKGDLHYIDMNSAKFVKYLRNVGLKDIHGKKSIPRILFSQPKELIEAFLIRYLSLDGYVGKQGQFEIYSKEMIPDLTVLFLKIGIIPNIRERPDPGFAKGKIQRIIYFSNYNFAVKYFDKTISPIHKKSLQRYFKRLQNTKTPRPPYHSFIPISFELLEKIRKKAGLSKNRIHKEYYLLNPDLPKSKALTRPFLKSVVVPVLKLATNCQELTMLDLVANGSFAFDRITEVRDIPYEGFVYNLTTDTANYIVNNILTHNSGGLGTPAHERVEAGLIHKAHKGVLFIDEIATLKLKTQHDLLTAMQEKRFQITGQSELSSGAMVRTEPVPCDFILIAAGNLDTVQKMHPALRSRIRGYGYEVYINETIPDTLENRRKYAMFVAQEVKKDGKIPHFTKDAVIEIIREGRRRAGRKGHLTLMLRDLGGLIRAAGDLASEQNAIQVTAEHIINSKRLAKSLEQQIGDKYIEQKREYEVIRIKGSVVGRVNGLAIIGDPRIGASGIVLPLEAEVVPALSSDEGRIIATGKLGDLANEAVQNVSALIKKYSGEDVSKYDIHIQFLQTHEGVEGDSASISVATAVFSSIRGLPIDQSVAMTGSLSVRGDVLPVGGVTPKIEAACEAGLTKVLIPEANKKDVILEAKYKDKVEIIPVKRIEEVLKHALLFDNEDAMDFLKVVGRTKATADDSEKKKFSIDFNQPVPS